MDNQDDKATVVQIVLNEFPLPGEQTPWEQIIDFRSDVASGFKIVRP